MDAKLNKYWRKQTVEKKKEMQGKIVELIDALNDSCAAVMNRKLELDDLTARMINNVQNEIRVGEVNTEKLTIIIARLRELISNQEKEVTTVESV